MSKMTVFEEFADRWLNRKVEFSLLGQRVIGTVTQVIDDVCAHHFIIAEFRDGVKQIKVGASYQAFRRIKE